MLRETSNLLAMQVDSSQYRMADRLTGGRLADIIAGLRAEDRSYEEITRRLFAEHGIEVTRQTVARWGALMGIDKAPAA